MKLSKLYILIILAGFFSCTEKLDTDFKGENLNFLAVDASISTDTTAHRVLLHRTVDFNAGEAKPETGAIISISGNDTLVYLTEVSAGVYETDPNFYGVEEESYELRIQTKDDSVYTASTTIPRLVQFDSIDFVREFFALAGEDHYFAIFYGQEPAGLGDAYMWTLYINDSLWNDSISETRFTNDASVDGNYVEYPFYTLDTKHVHQDTNLITLEFAAIPSNYETYIYYILTETAWRGRPWDPLPANVPDNISGTGVGYFYGAAITRKSIWYIKSIEEKEE